MDVPPREGAAADTTCWYMWVRAQVRVSIQACGSKRCGDGKPNWGEPHLTPTLATGVGPLVTICGPAPELRTLRQLSCSEDSDLSSDDARADSQKPEKRWAGRGRVTLSLVQPPSWTPSPVVTPHPFSLCLRGTPLQEQLLPCRARPPSSWCVDPPSPSQFPVPFSSCIT